jgi:transcriptional regulator with XRE-family HTH domain
MDKSNELNECVGTEVARRRRQLSLSQEELAFAAGLHRTYISLLERGCKSPTIGTLQRIAHALGTSVSLLIKSAEEYSDKPGRI